MQRTLTAVIHLTMGQSLIFSQTGKVDTCSRAAPAPGAVMMIYRLIVCILLGASISSAAAGDTMVPAVAITKAPYLPELVKSKNDAICSAQLPAPFIVSAKNGVLLVRQTARGHDNMAYTADAMGKAGAPR